MNMPENSKSIKESAPDTQCNDQEGSRPQQDSFSEQALTEVHKLLRAEIHVKSSRQPTDSNDIRYKDNNGNSIIENRQTGEIIARSSDSKTAYERKADGIEIVHDCNGGTIKDGQSGTYTRIDNDGTKTVLKLDGRDPADRQVATEFNKGFAVSQRQVRFSWRETYGQAGDSVMFADGIAHIHENGVRSVVLNDGTYIRDDRLGEVRIAGGKLEKRQMEGSYQPIAGGDPLLHHIQMQNDRFCSIMGVEVDEHGAVHTAGGQKIEMRQGNFTVSGKDRHGRAVAGTVFAGGVSEVVDGKGCTTRMNMDHCDHFVERRQLSGQEEFNYNEQNCCFTVYLPDSGKPAVIFAPGGTTLCFCNDATVYGDGSIQLADGSYMAGVPHESAGVQADTALEEANQSCDEAEAAISIGTCEFGDVSKMLAALGDLSGALEIAIAAGDLETAGRIIAARDTLEAVLAEAQVEAQVADELMASGISSQSAIAEAEHDIGTFTPDGAVEEEKRRLAT